MGENDNIITDKKKTKKPNRWCAGVWDVIGLTIE